MIVIAFYLAVMLVFTLYAMLSRSFSTYQFDIAWFEIRVSDDAGQLLTDPVLSSDLNAVSAQHLNT